MGARGHRGGRGVSSIGEFIAGGRVGLSSERKRGYCWKQGRDCQCEVMVEGRKRVINGERGGHCLVPGVIVGDAD